MEFSFRIPRGGSQLQSTLLKLRRLCRTRRLWWLPCCNEWTQPVSSARIAQSWEPEGMKNARLRVCFKMKQKKVAVLKLIIDRNLYRRKLIIDKNLYKRKVARTWYIIGEICENDLTLWRPANETTWSENLQISLGFTDSGVALMMNETREEHAKQEQLYHIYSF